MKAIASLFILTLYILCTTSCWDQGSADTDTPDQIEEESSEGKEEWSWEDYPAHSELTLATTPVTINPKKSHPIKAQGSGVLTLNLDDEVSTQKKGFVWAKMNTEKIRTEEEKMKIAEIKYSTSILREDTIEIPQKEADALKLLQEARKKVLLIRELRESNSLKDLPSLVDMSRAALTDSSLKAAEEELARAEQKAKFAQEYEKTLAINERRLQEIQALEKRKSFDLLKEQSEYTIPFDGELRIDLELISGERDYTVAGREVIAQLNDYSEIHAYLAMKNAKWIALEPESLYLELKDRSKTQFSFSDDRFIPDARGRNERNYVFINTLKENKKLRRLTGSTVDAKLIHKLEKPCYIVPKLALSMYALGRTTSTEWELIIKDLFPEAELYAEGLESLAIHLPSLIGKTPE